MTLDGQDYLSGQTLSLVCNVDVSEAEAPLTQCWNIFVGHPGLEPEQWAARDQYNNTSLSHTPVNQAIENQQLLMYHFM